jgi:hypothetical protein
MYLWLILSKINHLVKLLSSEQHLDDLQTNILFCNLSGWNCDCYDHQLRWKDWDLKHTWCVARWCRSWQSGARIHRCPKPISVLARRRKVAVRVRQSQSARAVWSREMRRSPGFLLVRLAVFGQGFWSGVATPFVTRTKNWQFG